ncbi:MAG: hypothetical protein R6U26_00420 [Candidatus Undinarchaeales archaeon]
MKKEVQIQIPKKLILYLTLVSIFIIGFFYLAFFTKINPYDVAKIGLLILVGTLSRLPQKMSRFSIGLELVTLSTIISAIMYGGLAGSFVGVSCFVLSGFYTKEAPQDVLIAIVAFAFLGWFSPLVYSYFGNIAVTGLVLTAVYDLGTNLIYVFFGHSILGCLKFSSVHIPSNYLILKYLGPKLLAL